VGERLRALGIALALVALAVVAACSPAENAYENPPLPGDAPRVVIATNHGDIIAGLYDELAPVTVANFLRYVDDGFFDGTAFHRVMPGFMIQGGGYIPLPDGTYRRKDRLPTIKLESDNGLKNLRGTLAMARGGAPDTASSEFFINLVDNQRLDRFGEVNLGYAVFGVVLEGMGVVDEIAAVDTVISPTFAQSGERAAPVESVIIRTIRRLN
jgi:peptidyl-prolyl cis-trans isomerase A (cyclophilin A)